MHTQFCAGIVTYNPSLDLLLRAVSSIIDQISSLVIIDNASKNIDGIINSLNGFSKIKFICNRSNLGIATALNQIGEFSKANGYTWFLTLDQDSICPNNLLEIYTEYILKDDIAIICPYILRRVNLNKEKEIIIDKEYEFIKVAITSGCLVRTKAWESVNGFWETLFIDRVDDDFCFALRDKGWKIYKTYKVRLEHEIGKPIQHSILGRTYYTDSYPDFRYYYIARNMIIVCNYYNNLPYNMYILLLKKFLKILSGENGKIGKMKSFLHGVADGLRIVRKGITRA